MRALVICFLLILPQLAPAQHANPAETRAQWQYVPAYAPAFFYQGRIDFTKPEAPVIIWQGSTVSFDTRAKTLFLGFDQLEGEVYFNLAAGGETQVIQASSGWHEVELPAADQPRTVTLFKRSEAAAGTVAFTGIRVPSTHKLATPAIDPSQLKLMFYGDSITVGACNEDGEEDQWQTVATHNTAKSYGLLTARALDAKFRSIAVSGVGIAAGYQPYTAVQIWNKYYPATDSPKADLAWQPDWLFINYGENDDSFTRNNDLPFPPQFVERYVALVREMRKAYPKAQIVLLRGGMYGGAKSERLIKPWQQAVNQLKNEDSKIHHFVFQHWSRLHPRASDHEVMAKELSQWLRRRLAAEESGISG